jgi:hypothetical protein
VRSHIRSTPEVRVKPTAAARNEESKRGDRAQDTALTSPPAKRAAVGGAGKRDRAAEATPKAQQTPASRSPVSKADDPLEGLDGL